MTWLLAVLLPLFAAAGLGLRSTAAFACRVLVPLSALPALIIALAFEPQAQVQLDWLLLGTRFGFGETGRVMLFVTALLWTVAGLYASSYLAADPRRRRFFVFFALTMSGNLGLVVAQDAASFYMFFSLMTFSAYGLIVHNADAEAYRAGRIYIVAAIFGEILMLAAIVLAVWEADTLLFAELRPRIVASPWHDLIVLFALVGFGVKAGAAFVHFWLPLAHPVAPVPASAVLSGAMIKAGLIGWVHFLPLGTGSYPGWAWLLLAAGYTAAFGAVAIGLTQRDPKTVLAYSSVSQIGVITSVLGLALLDARMWPLVMPAVLVFSLNHAFAKGALFLGVGVAAYAAPGRSRTAVLMGLAVAALAIAGAPYTGGAVAKHAAKYAITEIEADVYDALPAIMSLSSVATTLLLARFVTLVAGSSVEQGSAGTKPGILAPWAFLVAWVAVSVPWTIRWFALGIDPDDGFWTAAGPVLIGLVIFVVAAPLLRARVPAIPPGDVVVALEWVARRLGALRVTLPLRMRGWRLGLLPYLGSLAATEGQRDFSRRMELRLRRWENAMLAFAAVLLVFVVLLAL